MDIHAPEGPTRSFREFAIHILIVTIGILIALSLEGIRETIHNHHLVAETRENFREELQHDDEYARLELASVKQANLVVGDVLAKLPALRSQPAELRATLLQISFSGYFFGDNSWQAALSTGALAHMNTSEVLRYAYAFQGIREYRQIETQATPVWYSLRTFVPSTSKLSDTEFASLSERLLLMQQYGKAMEHVGNDMQSDIRQALKN